jgi:hypothetical protein|tara:strand:+ start:466 stop:1473 length:1008 start_codon:yes stop_codon:yes gene_type:complete
MSSNAIAELTTNPVNESTQQVQIGCNTLWSMGQQQAIQRLSEPKRGWFSSTPKQQLVASFSARAARIAATYARFYLEQEEGCNPEFRGRFYWMGLAAFASKQVKCALDFIPDDPLLALTPPLAQPALRISKNELGKGNFWLFQDIFVWHWFYANYPEQFEDCASSRNTANAEEIVEANISALPWAEAALATLNNLMLTSEITDAFRQIRVLEAMPNGEQKRALQLESLLAVADHEQINILQPLIYENWSFKRVLDAQGWAERAPFIPKRVAAFAISCDTDIEELRVEMSEGKLYNQADRMRFIRNVASRYHQLMDEQRQYMEETIKSFTSWSSAT